MLRSLVGVRLSSDRNPGSTVSGDAEANQVMAALVIGGVEGLCAIRVGLEWHQYETAQHEQDGASDE